MCIRTNFRTVQSSSKIFHNLWFGNIRYFCRARENSRRLNPFIFQWTQVTCIKRGINCGYCYTLLCCFLYRPISCSLRTSFIKDLRITNKFKETKSDVKMRIKSNKNRMITTEERQQFNFLNKFERTNSRSPRHCFCQWYHPVSIKNLQWFQLNKTTVPLHSNWQIAVPYLHSTYQQYFLNSRRLLQSTAYHLIDTRKKMIISFLTMILQQAFVTKSRRGEYTNYRRILWTDVPYSIPLWTILT